MRLAAAATADARSSLAHAGKGLWFDDQNRKIDGTTHSQSQRQAHIATPCNHQIIALKRFGAVMALGHRSSFPDSRQ